ncbi:MAG: L-serine ammonia-lyase, iron-sulfur-dependent, subunit alpha [Exilispira sp.]|jgi:L-serine dehydratase|nr:L-serine ammonia-lyase, iron-sulfur-dependent, subunit alpha [Exilispira sp.]
MDSIKSIYKIGKGPSSSHTMGPHRASMRFLQYLKENNMKFKKIKATLQGSLALTGKGHLTDIAIKEAFEDYLTEVIFDFERKNLYHPNTMILEALDEKDKVLSSWEVYSIGGGEIIIKNLNSQKISETNYESELTEKEYIYPYSTMKEILVYLKKMGKSFWEFIEDYEGKGIWNYLDNVWKKMKDEIERGLINEGVLPGSLCLQRKASSYFIKANSFSGLLKKQTLIFSYALATAEENAAGGIIVTAPTCGSSGVLPAVLYFLKKELNIAEQKILKALATAALIGKLVQTNASISGAEVGCQGEIGTACSMAAAAAAQLMGATPFQIEYAAEIGLEHHLGLTCDPLGGYVQIPCIERNAFAASRAYDAAIYGILSDGNHKISFDSIVDTMKRTGNDLPHIYKETSLGGIATIEEG